MSGQLALLGGPRVIPKGKRWPIYPELTSKHQSLLLDVLYNRNWYWGRYIHEFAERYAEYCGARYALMVSSGTSALECALKAIGIGPGDEVIVPALTWNATAQAVLSCNGIVVFADVLEDTWCLDPRDFEAKITERTKAVIPVHLYNRMAEMEEIIRIAERHHLAVIEDCSHSQGSVWGDKGAGALGTLGAFSFQMSKVLAGGEGGLVTTNDEFLYRRMRSHTHVWEVYQDPVLMQEGAVNDLHAYGSNYRPTEFQAAVLLASLELLPQQVARRYENMQYLDSLLAGVKGIRPLRQQPQVTLQSAYCYAFQIVPEELGGIPRQKFQKAVSAEGLPLGIPFEPVYRSKMFGYDPVRTSISCGLPPNTLNYRSLYLPVTEKIAAETGLIFSHSYLLGERSDMELIAEAIRKVAENSEALRDYEEPSL